MPKAKVLKSKLQSMDFDDFPQLTLPMVRQLDNVIDVDIHQVGAGKRWGDLVPGRVAGCSLREGIGA